MKKKRLLSFVMAAAMLFGSAATLPEGVISESTSITASAAYDSYEYIVLDDGTIEITQYNYKDTLIETVVIPSTIDGKTVTRIGDKAFYNSHMDYVTIPEGVTSIGNNAFSCCSWLRTVKIPSSVINIEQTAFDSCSRLQSFYVDSSNNNYCSVNGILYDKYMTTLIRCPKRNSITAFDIPNVVKTIGSSAFLGCENLTSVTIPNSVTSIGSSAFSGCTKLASVTISNSVTSIGEYAFDSTIWLENKRKETPLVIVNGILIDGKNVSGNVTIPDSVLRINDRVFRNCESITSVTIPNSVTSIGSSAFSGCTKLASVKLSDGLTIIGEYAFYNCSSLTSVTIPNSVTSIGSSAFYGCTKLASVAISNSVTSIGEYAFNSTIWLENKRKETPLVIVNGILIDGKNVSGNVTIPDSVLRITDRAFNNCERITSVTIPKSVISIGSYAFSLCYKLENVVISDGVESIGDYVFTGCENLKSVTMPDRVSSLGSGLFNGCTRLYKVTIPSGITEIGHSMFSDCSMLIASIRIPDGVTRIGYSAFSDCHNLFSVTIPSSVKIIEYGAFYKCHSLTDLSIPFGVESIGSNAFYNCLSIKSIDIPSSVTSIGNDAFLKCSLKSVTIPKTVTSIGSHAFGYNYNENTSTYSKVSGFKIYCIEGSAAEEYAKNNGFEYEYFICKHDYASIIVDPTCTEKGYTKNLCKNCGNLIINKNSYVDELGHDYSDEKIIDPTCTVQGYTVHTCTRCKDNFRSDYVNALGHNYTDTVTAPNCTEKGYTTHTCTRCDYSYKDKYTNPVADAHVYGDWIITFETTDTICGTKERLCKLCKHREVFIDHDKEYVKTVAPTCTEKGYDIYNCKRCGEELNENFVDATGHDWKESKWIWDGDSNAKLKFICQNDNSHVQYVDAKVTQKTKSPTCTKSGTLELTATATFGGTTYTDYQKKTINSTGHNWGEPTWRWNGVDASVYFVCSNNSSHTQGVTARVNQKTIIAATCTSDGLTEYTATATFNGNQYTDTTTATVKAKGHNWSGWSTTLNPTCSYDGEKERRCYSCGLTETQTISKTSHSYTKTIVNPTMTQDGYTTYKCSICGYSYKGDITKAATSGKCGDNLTWTFSNGRLTISGTGSMYNWDPHNNNNSPLVSDKITSIVIGSGVTSIGNWAFTGCTKLKSVSIPATVKTIGEGTFQNCYHLSSVAIPNGVTSIGDGAFWCCFNLASVSLPSSLRTIGYLTFGGCTSLKSIVIPNGVTTIGEAAFSGSNSLASISIPSTVKTIGARAFDSTKWLSTMRSKNPLVVVNGLLVDAQTYKGATLTLSSSIKGICGCAFSECKNLTSITIPSSVTRIGNDAFYNCTKLKSIVIPNSVQSIENFTFYGCTSLSSVTIGSGVKSIGYSAFHDTQNLKSITIPATAGTIDEYAFGYYYDTKTKKTAKISGFTIYGFTGSTAEKYAKNNGFKFVSKGTHTHSYINTVVAATCKTKGYTTHKCKTCGYTCTDTYTAVNANAHKFGSWAITSKATVSTKGSMKRTCSLCGKIETTSYVYYSRIAGQNRFATAVEVSKASFSSADTVVLAYGLNYADALAGVPLAYKYKAPILLTHTDKMPTETINEIKRLKAKNIIILGGTGAISTKVESQLVQNGIVKSRITRYYGSSRFGTATSVAKALNPNPTEIFFVYANNSADALSISVVAAIKGAPIIYLSTKGTLDNATKAYLTSVRKSVKSAYVIGGTGVISDAMKKQADSALGITSKRLYGKDRFETCVSVNNEFRSILSGNMICVATGLDYPDALAGGVYAAINKSPLFLINGKTNTLNLSNTQKNLLKGRAPVRLSVFGGTGAVSENSVLIVSSESVKS